MQPSRGVFKKRFSDNMQQIAGEHLYRSVTPMKLQSNFIEITLQHGCSPVNLLHIFRTTFPKNTYGGLLPEVSIKEIIVTYTEFLTSLSILNGTFDIY